MGAKAEGDSALWVDDAQFCHRRNEQCFEHPSSFAWMLDRVYLRLVFATGRPSPPSWLAPRRCHPRGRPAAPFALAGRESFKDDDGVLDVFPLASQFGKHLQDVHLPRITGAERLSRAAGWAQGVNSCCCIAGGVAHKQSQEHQVKSRPNRE